jgi:hypothetical protein
MCLSEFIYRRYTQSCWYFRPSFVNCCPSPLFVWTTTFCINFYESYLSPEREPNFFSYKYYPCLVVCCRLLKMFLSNSSFDFIKWFSSTGCDQLVLLICIQMQAVTSLCIICIQVQAVTSLYNLYSGAGYDQLVLLICIQVQAVTSLC